MPPARVCSECGKSLAGMHPRAKTCSNLCRVKRSRRERRTKQRHEEITEQPHGQVVYDIVNREAQDLVRDALKHELIPIVRESIDEDVLQAIGSMVKLTPPAVQALYEDLHADDKVIRQRAYSLVIKYTIGHPALVKPSTEAKGGLEVHFNLPRPEGADANVVDVEPAAAEELRVCDMCNKEHPAGEFVAGSSRCRACFDTWKAEIVERFS